MTNDEMREKCDKMMEFYGELKREVRQRDKQLFERWKAGGCMIDDDFVNFYPSLSKVMETLAPDGDDVDPDAEDEGSCFMEDDNPQYDRFDEPADY